MIKLDPVLAVKDVAASATWYEKVFGFKRAHGGEDFAVLISKTAEVILCLHKWGEHQHPSLTDQTTIAGNGLLLYFKTDDIEVIRKRIEKMACAFEEEIHENPNSMKKEFSVKDPDGYFLTISEYHDY